MNKKLPKVLLFQEDEKALNYKYKYPDYVLGKDIEVKSFEYDVDELKEAGIKFIGGEPKDNAVYFLHPYKENTYVSETQPENYFLEEKLELYKRVASLLGAKKIETKVGAEESQKIEVDAQGNVTFAPVAKLEGGVKIEKNQNNKISLEIEDSFELQPNFNLHKNIEELRSLIEKFNLHHEIGIISLIDSRDSTNSGTLLKKRKIKSEITSEYNHLLEISAKLNVKAFEISATFKRKVEKMNKLTLEITFEF
ncbi:hypothetical protein [Capnocytophaga stomatis]|uniref:Uncharacterized protein n=1 Tax=Capnocytophaga stomatis TaxID=1848904 RepID=A0ABW8Q7U6_9FLAO|nr:hypothetical protein [Capnocytophaga canimorsus]WGU67568.1 hypothetical protein QIU19_08355 [Capnocytophaga canimorsus]